MLRFYHHTNGTNHYLRVTGELELDTKLMNDDEKLLAICRVYGLLDKLDELETKGLAKRDVRYPAHWDLEEIGGMDGYLEENTEVWT